MLIKHGYVYILANVYNTVLYIGVTSNLIKRIWEHKNSYVEGFTKKYKLHKLLYYEQFSTIQDAISREKQIKNWKREWKLNLITSKNPQFKDLYSTIT